MKSNFPIGEDGKSISIQYQEVAVQVSFDNLAVSTLLNGFKCNHWGLKRLTNVWEDSRYVDNKIEPCNIWSDNPSVVMRIIQKK